MKKPKGKGWKYVGVDRNGNPHWRRLHKTNALINIKGSKGIITKFEIKRAKDRVKKFNNPNSHLKKRKK